MTTSAASTPLDTLSRMSSDAIAAQAAEICRIKKICDQVVKQSNGGISNPAQSGQILNLMLADIAARRQTKLEVSV